MTSIVEIISHYQKSIDRSLNDEARLVHCIGKLYRLPVSVQHLQETGIGRTVNGLRKYDGEVGVAAKALVSKWKNMVAAEESDTGEPEPQHQNRAEDEDEDNYDESCLQVDEDRHSDDHQEEEVQDDEDGDDEMHNHQQEVESDIQEELQTPQQVSNGHDSDHQSTRSSHRDSDRHRSSSSSKHRSDRHGHHSSSSSKDSSRSHDRHDRHRDGDKTKHHSSSSSSSKGHSSSSSSKKSSRHEDEEKEKKDRHSDRKNSSHTSGKESTHSSSKEKTSSNDKHHSKSKERLNGFTKEAESSKRKRASEDEEESAAKKEKQDQPSESKSKSSSKSSSSSTSKDKSSSKPSSSSSSSKEKDKSRSSEKKKKSSSKRKSEQHSDSCDDDVDDDDNSGGASFADALAMIGMPSSSKKKHSSKGSADKAKSSSGSSAMPPPPAKSAERQRSSSSSGYSSCSSTPPLLAQKPKLTPLAVADIVESLPQISPNYKPMPLNQTVMECVFSNNGKPQKRQMTEEEALGHSMQSKNIRTKVYSGVKTTGGAPPTLYSLCIRLLQEHIELIDYTGGIPFDLLKPVLERASPMQLATLEGYNPYLLEDTDVLWEQHCRRNFRSEKRKEEECESWREMFIRCSEERESKLQSLTANIKQSQVAKTAPIRKTQLAYVDSAVKPPRNVLSKQARYGTAQTPVVSPAARVAALKNSTTNVAKAGDSRLKVVGTGRDTAQVQVFHPTKPKKAPLMSKVMQSIKGFKGFRR